jgi:hypothetical protein
MNKYLSDLVEWTKKHSALNIKSKNPFKDAHESFIELYDIYDNNTYIKTQALQYYNDRELFNKNNG